MAIGETVVWIFIAYMVVPLVVLLGFWIVGLVRDSRKKAKKAQAAEAAEAKRDAAGE